MNSDDQNLDSVIRKFADQKMIQDQNLVTPANVTVESFDKLRDAIGAFCAAGKMLNEAGYKQIGEKFQKFHDELNKALSNFIVSENPFFQGWDEKNWSLLCAEFYLNIG